MRPRSIRQIVTWPTPAILASSAREIRRSFLRAVRNFPATFAIVGLSISREKVLVKRFLFHQRNG
jgi:hypothetical protein